MTNGSLGDGMKTVGEVVREYLPDADADEIEHVVWGHTGYPGFWNIPADGVTPEECFRTQLARYRDGKELTLCCDPEGVSMLVIPLGVALGFVMSVVGWFFQ